jgi:hypothetical protein
MRFISFSCLAVPSEVKKLEVSTGEAYRNFRQQNSPRLLIAGTKMGRKKQNLTTKDTKEREGALSSWLSVFGIFG